MIIKKANLKRFIMVASLLALIVLGFYSGGNYLVGNVIKMDYKTIVVLETNLGEIEIELFEDMPITAGNFEKLVKDGFYDGVIFHRVIDGFMIQGGDPTGTGTGGPGYTIKDEFTKSVLDKNNRGTISMANT